MEPTIEQPPIVPPQNKKKLLIIGGAAALIIVGLIAWLVWPKQPQALTLGSHRYLQACQIFTAADFKELTSQEADSHSVSATYAQELPKNTTDKNFTSSCGRRAPISKAENQEDVSYFLELTQYHSDTVATDLMLRPNDKSTPDLVSKFGQGASLQGSFTGTSTTLQFLHENKIVKVRVRAGFGTDLAAFEPKVIALGEAMLKKLKSTEATTEVFSPGSKNERVGEFAYIPPCSTLDGTQFKAATGRPLNLAEIETLYAEKTEGLGAETLLGKCEVTTDEAVDSRGQIRIETAQSANQESAIYRYENSLDGEAKEIPNIADKAQLLPKKVRILKNNTVITLTLVNGFKGTESEAEAVLTKLAQMIVARL